MHCSLTGLTALTALTALPTVTGMPALGHTTLLTWRLANCFCKICSHFHSHHSWNLVMPCWPAALTVMAACRHASLSPWPCKHAFFSNVLTFSWAFVVMHCSLSGLLALTALTALPRVTSMSARNHSTLPTWRLANLFVKYVHIFMIIALGIYYCLASLLACLPWQLQLPAAIPACHHASIHFFSNWLTFYCAVAVMHWSLNGLPALTA